MIRKILYYLKNPKKVPGMLMDHFRFSFLTDRAYINLMFYLGYHRFPDLDNPITFNEKIQWFKLNDRNPNYTKLVDKYEVKQIVAELIGDKYIIPTLGVWDRFEDINFDDLPDQFVLKCTHDSGGIELVQSKSLMNLNSIRKHLNREMKRNYYWFGREWAYKDIQPRIIAEKYIGSEDYFVPDDYKIFCFNGEPKLIHVDFDRFGNHRRNLYDTDWKFIHATIKYPNDPNHIIKKPENLRKMLDIARILSKDYRHVRVDLYNLDGQIYFGELTFYHGSGMEVFTPEEFGIEMGSWIKL